MQDQAGETKTQAERPHGSTPDDLPSAPFSPAGLTPAEAATQRKMKAVVIGLGVLIMLAFAGVVFGMVYRASQIGKGSGVKTNTATSHQALPGAGASSPAGGTIPNARGAVSPAPLSGPGSGPGADGRPWQAEIRLALPAGNVVKSATLHGSSLIVQHEGPAGPGITILDLASGKVVSRVLIEASPAR